MDVPGQTVCVCGGGGVKIKSQGCNDPAELKLLNIKEIIRE